MVMDVVGADKIKMMEEEKVGVLGTCLGQSYSWCSISRTYGPQYIFS
jgi:hypothetical protein